MQINNNNNSNLNPNLALYTKMTPKWTMVLNVKSTNFVKKI